MACIINGVEVRLARTRDALTFTATGRTKFYEYVARLGIKPISAGNRSLWRAEDLEQIVDFIEGRITGRG
jgi:hypothetical protein